jgi:hypothetical protein
MTKTITSLYDSYNDALETVNELKRADVPDSDISLVSADPPGARTSSDGATGNMTDTGVGQGAAIGGVLGAGAGLAAGLGALAIPGIGPVVAVGWLIPTIIGAAVGASGGGIVGALIGAGVSEEHAHVYAETVRRGGAVVTVRVDEEDLPTVEAIMAQRAVNPEAKATLYRSAGWTRFDADAPPYSEEAERTVSTTTVRQTTPRN